MNKEEREVISPEEWWSLGQEVSDVEIRSSEARGVAFYLYSAQVGWPYQARYLQAISKLGGTEQEGCESPHFLQESDLLDLGELQNAIERPGHYRLITCSCGAAECAMRSDGVSIAHRGDQLLWQDWSTFSFFVFSRSRLRTELEKAITWASALIDRPREGMTRNLSGDYFGPPENEDFLRQALHQPCFPPPTFPEEEYEDDDSYVCTGPPYLLTFFKLDDDDLAWEIDSLVRASCSHRLTLLATDPSDLLGYIHRFAPEVSTLPRLLRLQLIVEACSLTLDFETMVALAPELLQATELSEEPRGQLQVFDLCPESAQEERASCATELDHCRTRDWRLALLRLAFHLRRWRLSPRRSGNREPSRLPWFRLKDSLEWLKNLGPLSVQGHTKAWWRRSTLRQMSRSTLCHPRFQILTSVVYPREYHAWLTAPMVERLERIWREATPPLREIGLTVGPLNLEQVPAPNLAPLPWRSEKLFSQRKNHLERRRYELEKRIRGAIYGLAVGDAFGVLTEGLAANEVRQFYPQGIRKFRDLSQKKRRQGVRPGTWTGETHLFVTFLKSLEHYQGVNLLDLAQHLKAWCASDPWELPLPCRPLFRAPGYTTDPRATCKAFVRGRHKDCQAWPYHPLYPYFAVRAWYGTDDTGAGRSRYKVADGLFGVQPDRTLLAAWVRLLFGRGREAAYHAFPELHPLAPISLPPDAPVEALELEDMTGRLRMHQGERLLRWLLERPRPFPETLLEVISCGGHAGEYGALTGTYLGALHGCDAIPRAWMEGLKSRDILEQAVEIVLKRSRDWEL